MIEDEEEGQQREEELKLKVEERKKKEEKSLKIQVCCPSRWKPHTSRFRIIFQ